MGRFFRWKVVAAALLAALFAACPVGLQASDHADPTGLTNPETNITGLFFFPQGDRMILILNVRRSLLKPKPYNLEPFLYEINMDLTTPVSFNDPAERARYGGTVVTPKTIHPDVRIQLLLKDDVTLKDVKYEGLTDTNDITEYFGVRDDPFIFPRFFKVNVISMVMSIPKASFPPGQHDFILWATTSKDGKVEDFVGRSLRTQLPRFSMFLNAIAPKDQVEVLKKGKWWTDLIYNFFKNKREGMSQGLAELFHFTFQLREYDMAPDVMIYSDRFPAGYPNGRQLADDVVAISCSFGDCLLQELSFIEGKWPRKTTNDKEFLSEWPYVGEPVADGTEAGSSGSILPYAIPAIALVAIVIWVIVEVIRRLILWLWRSARRKESTAPA